MKTLVIWLMTAACVSGFAQSATDAAAKAEEVKREANQYSATMRYANFLDRATNQVPKPEKVSELYLKDLGDFKVTCQTNRRSGTIEYHVVGSTNLALAFSSLKQMPNRTRISQGTNSVTVAIKLPTTQ